MLVYYEGNYMKALKHTFPEIKLDNEEFYHYKFHKYPRMFFQNGLL